MELDVLAGFQEVFTFLKSQKCNIADDAILHLFVDMLKITLKDKESIKASYLIEFLADVGDLVNILDDGIISLTLEIAGWLGSDDDRFICYQQHLSKLVRTVWQKSSVSDVSVLSSLFNCLTSITGHLEGLEWLIKHNEDIHNRWLSILETGSSIFLQKAVVNYICKLYIHNRWLSILETGSSIFLQKAVVNYICKLCTAPHIETFTPFLENIIKLDIAPIVSRFTADMKEQRKGNGQTYLISVLKLLEEMNASDLVCNIVVSTDMAERLAYIVLTASRPLAQATFNVLKVLYMKRKDQVTPTVEKLTKQLYSTGDILMAQNVTVMRIQSNENVLESRELLLNPLRYALGDLKKGTICETSAALVNLSQQMSTKQHIATVLSRTIGNLLTVNVAVPELISTLLARTVSGCYEANEEISQHLRNNIKIQRSCLQYLCHLEDLASQKDLTLTLTSTLIQLMTPSDVQSQIYSSCVKCLLPILPSLVNTSSPIENSREKVALALQQQLCSLHWEQRDTTLELLSEVIMRHKEYTAVIAWMKENKLHHHAWQCKQDGESFVRATAFSCLYSVSTCSLLWESLLNITGLTEAEVIQEICDILECDTEAFSRRSAANLLYKYYSDRDNSLQEDISQCIVRALASRMQDFDWEVKLLVLDFLGELFKKEIKNTSHVDCIPEYARGLHGNSESNLLPVKDTGIVLGKLKKYFDLGCLQAVVMAIDDYDRKVSEKAAKVIVELRLELKLISDNIGLSEGELQEYLAKNYDGTKRETSTPNGDASVIIHDNTINSNFIQCITEILKFEEAKHVHKYSDDNDYIRNPLSIIQDILSYGSKPEEDNVVDCY